MASAISSSSPSASSTASTTTGDEARLGDRVYPVDSSPSDAEAVRNEASPAADECEPTEGRREGRREEWSEIGGIDKYIC